MIMPRGRLFTWLVVVATLCPGRAEGQPAVASFADLIAMVHADEPLVVTETTGRRVRGALIAVDARGLSLRTGGRTQTFAERDVSTIQALDGLTDGTLIGAGIGLAAALTVLAVLASRAGYVLPSARTGAPLLLGAAGAAVGAVVDRAHDRGRLLYVAPPPVAWRKRR